MGNKIYAVIDTNVIVSALISHSLDSSTVKILKAITQERIVPLFNEEILIEYREVLSRTKFRLSQSLIDNVLKAIEIDGLNMERTVADELVFPDPKDVIFYEVALSKENSFLITGNIKHFPIKPFVITPREMVILLGL